MDAFRKITAVTALFLAGCAGPDANPPVAPNLQPARAAIVRNATFVVNSPEGNLMSELERTRRREIDLSSGTPLTRDGYILTAAHSLEKAGSVAIGVQRNGKLRWIPARIVWVDPRSDVGIIKADATFPEPWQWTRENTPSGAAVLQGGIGDGIRHSTGKLLGRVPAGTGGGSRKFKHSIPIAAGDSGGPVVTGGGELLGINSSLTAFLPMSTVFFLEATAVRPDPAAIGQRIAQDRSAHP